MTRNALILSAILPCVACSSVLDGTSQEILVNTYPAGATCMLLRNGEQIATITPTPGSALVRKTKRDINVICDKAGYARVVMVDHSGLAAATAADILVPGVGWAVASASGADNKYATPVNLTFTQATIPAGPPIDNLASAASIAPPAPTAVPSSPPAATIAPPAQAYMVSWQNGPLYYYAGPAMLGASAQAGYPQFVPPGYTVAAVAPPQPSAPSNGVATSGAVSAPRPAPRMPPGWLLPAPPSKVTATPIAPPPEPAQPAIPAGYPTDTASAAVGGPEPPGFAATAESLALISATR
jgi:hypothetical protein